MPAKLAKVAGWLERQGATVEKPKSGSHWKARFTDGSVFPLPAHNALKTEISDVYLGKLAKRFGLTLADLLQQL
jgi:hypothetical protein